MDPLSKIGSNPPWARGCIPLNFHKFACKYPFAAYRIALSCLLLVFTMSIYMSSLLSKLWEISKFSDNAPNPTSQASVWSIKGSEKLRHAIIGGDISCSISLSKIRWCVLFQITELLECNWLFDFEACFDFECPFSDRLRRSWYTLMFEQTFLRNLVTQKMFACNVTGFCIHAFSASYSCLWSCVQ